MINQETEEAMKKILNVGTLFSGGLAAPEFALKYEKIKHRVIFACEVDKWARKQYLEFHNEPEYFFNDVKDFDGKNFSNEIDLLVWGSPCQDLSIAGKRKGLSGEKSSLFRVAAKIQREIKPKVFIFENVTGLLSSNNGADYQEVLNTFSTQGYKTITLKMNTKDFGIPQNRNRIFIIGFLDAEKYNNFREPKPKKLKLKLKDLLQKDVNEKYFLSYEMLSKFQPKAQGNKICNKDVFHTITSGSHGYSNGYVDLKQIGNIDQKGNNSRWGRVYDPDGLAPTLIANGGGAGAKTGLYKIKSNIRRLTPYETFLLQGVKPGDIKLVNSDTQSYKIAGNAMSVNVLQEILKSIYKEKYNEKR